MKIKKKKIKGDKHTFILFLWYNNYDFSNVILINNEGKISNAIQLHP